MSERFTRIWAGLMVVIGLVFIVLGVVLAGIALFTEEWRQGVTGTQVALERAVLVGGLVFSGLLAGSPFVVFGQLLQIFMDQRRLLARIDRHLRKLDAPPVKERDRYPKLK
jgi:TRAP-type C4-dicarboxylate transport system permease small subunit